VGEGRCKLHGGKSPGGPHGNQKAKTHGAYAKVYDDTLSEDEAALLTRTAGVNDYLQEQIGFVRIRMRRVTRKIEDADELWPEAENALSGLQRELRQLLKLRADLEAQRETHDDNLDELLQQIGEIRRRHSD
jgi:uncharacterized protein YjcR